MPDTRIRFDWRSRSALVAGAIAGFAFYWAVTRGGVEGLLVWVMVAPLVLGGSALRLTRGRT